MANTIVFNVDTNFTDMALGLTRDWRYYTPKHEGNCLQAWRNIFNFFRNVNGFFWIWVSVWQRRNQLSKSCLIKTVTTEHIRYLRGDVKMNSASIWIWLQAKLTFLFELTHWKAIQALFLFRILYSGDFYVYLKEICIHAQLNPKFLDLLFKKWLSKYTRTKMCTQI